jgi:hypothetical protein
MGAMKRVALVLIGLLAACPQPTPEKPGSPSNPVETCREAGQVCKTGDAPLGVCTSAKTRCEDPNGCFVCAPQH